jgi:hypothetical protein
MENISFPQTMEGVRDGVLTAPIPGDRLLQQVAAALAAFRKRPVTYRELPMEVIRRNSEDMASMYEWFNEVSYDADIDQLRRTFPDIGWHGYVDWLSEQDMGSFAPRG